MQTQTEPAATTPPIEHVFDEHGQTIPAEHAELEHDPVAEAARAAAEAGDTASAGGEAAAMKFRIGDREFATQQEALDYATSQVSALQTERQVSDAYQQGLKDALSAVPGTASGVTPAAEPPRPKLDTTELFSKPEEFLEKYAQRIKSETINEVTQANSLRAQSDQIWHEFSSRHPQLADFRSEVEGFVQSNLNDVRSVIQTKGRPASYDFIATKLKSTFERYSEAMKPNRALPNNTTTASAAPKVAGVTPKETPKKALSFSEQVNSIRKRR